MDFKFDFKDEELERSFQQFMLQTRNLTLFVILLTFILGCYIGYTLDHSTMSLLMIPILLFYGIYLLIMFVYFNRYLK